MLLKNTAYGVLLLLASANAATGQFYDGNRIHRACTTPPEKSYQESAFCFGYVTAAFDALTAQGYDCPGTGKITAQQIREIATNYLTKHPEIRHFPAYPLIASALISTFGCKRK